MIECEGIAKKWGNSLGVIIPKEVAEQSGIRETSKVHFAILNNKGVADRMFGSLKGWKEPTEKIMRRIRKNDWRQ